MFNLKKYSQVIIPTEKMLMDNNKEHGLEPPQNPGNYEYLLKTDRKNDTPDVIYEKLSEDTRKDAISNAESKGATGEVIMEKMLDQGKDTFNPTRTDDKDKIPLMDYSKEAENKLRDAFVKENKKDDRDTDFWDKYIGIQLTNEKTTITSNSQTSQLTSNFDSRKEMNKENPMIDKPKKDISKVAQKINSYNSEVLDKTKIYPVMDKVSLVELEHLGFSKEDFPHGPLPSIGQGVRNVGAMVTGEKRPPKKGEWYLSGSTIEAYRAPNDLTTPYHIAKLVRTRTTEPTIELDSQTIEYLKTADAMLYHIYKTANGRDLTEKEKQMVNDINSGKIRTIAQYAFGEEPEDFLMNDIEEDRSMFANPGGRSAWAGKKEFPCPTCKQPNKLTLKDVQLGYQCNQCADTAEGRFGKSKQIIKESQFGPKQPLDRDDGYNREPDTLSPFDGDEEKIEDRDMEQIPEEPQEDDIVIGQDDRSAYYSGKKIITVKDPEELRPAIKAWMDKEQFFPNVWVISDHGNPLNVTSEVIKSEQKQEVPFDEDPNWLADHEHTGFASTYHWNLKEAQFSPAEADHEMGSGTMVMEGDKMEEQQEIEKPQKPEKIEEKPIQYAVEYNNGTSWVTLNNGKLFEDAAKAGTYMERQINRMTKMDPQIRREDLLSKLRMVPRK